MVIQHYKKLKKNKKIYISDVNEILKGNHYSAEQKSAIKNIKTLHESQEKVIKVFNDYYQWL